MHTQHSLQLPTTRLNLETAAAQSSATALPTNLVVVSCSHCGRQVPLGPLLAYLSILKVSRDGTALVKVESPATRGKPTPGLDPSDVCLAAFHGYLRDLNERHPPSNQFKTKKIKKRGRKKWVARHDLLLEGSVLLWGDDISKIMRLLPEFNENVIRRKLGHVLWKSYSVTSASKRPPEIDEVHNSVQTTPKKSTCSRAINPPALDEPAAYLSVTARETEELFPVEGHSDFSIEKSAAFDDKTRWGTAQTSEDRLSQAFKPVVYLPKARHVRPEAPLQELEAVHQNISRFHVGDFGNAVPSFADLSKVFSEGVRGFKEFLAPTDSRRDFGFYQNSLVDIFNFERNSD